MTPIYERTVVGIWLLIFSLVMAGMMLTLMTLGDDADAPLWAPALLLIAPLIFGLMRISVTRDELRIRFWAGFPRRTVTLAEIEAYRVTRSKRETGFGISVKPSHGRYCIAGPSAVAVLLRNGRTLLVGTPEPEKLVKALDRARKAGGRRE